MELIYDSDLIRAIRENLKLNLPLTDDVVGKIFPEIPTDKQWQQYYNAHRRSPRNIKLVAEKIKEVFPDIFTSDEILATMVSDYKNRNQNANTKYKELIKQQEEIIKQLNDENHSLLKRLAACLERINPTE